MEYKPEQFFTRLIDFDLKDIASTNLLHDESSGKLVQDFFADIISVNPAVAFWQVVRQKDETRRCSCDGHRGKADVFRKIPDRAHSNKRNHLSNRLF